MSKSGRRHTDICTYLKDGITWAKMLAIAVQPLDRGGLNLMSEHSAEFVICSRPAPPKVIEDRPETDYKFLMWLVPRQSILTKLVDHDVQQRNLKMKQALAARESLNNRLHCVMRAVDVVLVKRALFLQ